MFTTQLPFPALDMLRQADTPTGLPTGPHTTAAQLALIGELVGLGLARSVSTSDGQPGVQTTADGRVELARLDASYYSDVNATTGQASNGNFGTPANPVTFTSGGFVTPGADVFATTGQASNPSAYLVANGVSPELADAITSQAIETQFAVKHLDYNPEFEAETTVADSVIDATVDAEVIPVVEVAAEPEVIPAVEPAVEPTVDAEVIPAVEPTVEPTFTGITEAKVTAPADDAAAGTEEKTQDSKSTAEGK